MTLAVIAPGGRRPEYGGLVAQDGLMAQDEDFGILGVVCAIRYKDTSCPVHLPRQPTAKTTMGTGTSGNEPGPWRMQSAGC